VDTPLAQLARSSPSGAPAWGRRRCKRDAATLPFVVAAEAAGMVDEEGGRDEADD